MHRLQIRICAIEAVTHPIILQSEHFMLWHHIAFDHVTCVIIGVARLRILINVIPQVQHHIQVSIGHVSVSVKETLRIVRTRRDTHSERCHLANGQGLGLSGFAVYPETAEAIKISGAGQ